MAINRLEYNDMTFTDLWNVNVIMEDSLPLDTLPADSLTADVEDPRLEDHMMSKSDLLIVADGVPIMIRPERNGLKRYKYGEIVKLYHRDILVGKFYLESITRIGRARWRFSAVSGIGLLITSYHWGGMYQNAKMADVAKEIIGGIVPYTLDETLGQTLISGWLPKATRRDNLRALLMAAGGRVRKTEAGDIEIVPYVEQQPYEIERDSFYLDGSSVTDGNPASQVLVTEHSFFVSPEDEEVTLFDGAAAAAPIVSPKGDELDGAMVDFSDPVHDLAVEGASILEQGVNYAILSGSPAATLKGKKYTHTERIISRDNKAATIPNVQALTDCCLINFMNSEIAAERLLAYYGSAKKTDVGMVLTNQKPGDVVSFTDPYGDRTQGYIEKLNINMSNTVKAEAAIVSDFSPPGGGQRYTREVILTGSGTWTVPSDVESIRFVLFSGATGGYAGKAGTDAGASQTYTASITEELSKQTTNYKFLLPKDGGKGGAGGAGGSGSRIYEGRMDVTAQQKITYACGAGGNGGTFSPDADNPGAEGAATIFGEHSSSSGAFPSASGWVDVMTGTVYAKRGGEGLPGGDSAKFREEYTIPENIENMNKILLFTEATSATDESGKLWTGGSTPIYESEAGVLWHMKQFNVWEVHEGGLLRNPVIGAIGHTAGKQLAPGGAAGASPKSCETTGSYEKTYATGASGLNGCVPSVIPGKPSYTMGGRGGYGGGGGSPAGFAAGGKTGNTNGMDIHVTPGTPGKGGAGGQGGTGGDGMIIVYY